MAVEEVDTMSWFGWYVALGIPAQLLLMALALDWWNGYEIRRNRKP